jgi:hypothetical protein
VKKKITAIIDTARAPEHPVSQNWQSEKGGRRFAVLERRVEETCLTR